MKKNTNKAYGIRQERIVRQILLDRGAKIAIRSRGSLGVFDVLAVFDTYSLWVQVKAGSENYIKRCIKEWRDIEPEMPPHHNVELWCRIKGQSKWQVITREG